MKNRILKSYMLTVIALGAICLLWMLFNVPFEKLDLKFLFLAAITIGFGSRITIQIPRINTHISVSDAFIFLALLLYGGELAIILAAVEAFCSSRRFCKQSITVFFNAGLCVISTSLVVLALNICGIDTVEELHGDTFQDFAATISTLVLVQFFANSGLASVYGALKSEKPWWETWKTHYLWTFITYFTGALTAALLVKLIDSYGFIFLLTTVPLILLVYFTYRMYMKNVQISVAQAEQAERHARILEKQSAALRESETRFRSAFDYAPIGIALVSPTGSWLKVNYALCQIFGYTEKEFLASDFQTMIAPEDLGSALIKINDLSKNKIRNCQLEQRYLHKNGQVVWVSWSVSAASDTKSSQTNLIFQILDITAKKLAEEKLQYDAEHDALTNLPNRKCFMSRLRDALDKSKSEPFYNVSVLFIDLDRFKSVNDSLGHHVGDELLIGISARLRDCVRPTDTVARLGGDEFTMLIEGRYDPAEVIRIAERIQKKFSQPFNLSGNEIYSSASIGILHASDKHLSPADMMRDADTAMYQAKRAGKSRHEVFDENMHEAAKETLQLETDLRRAVEHDDFTVLYQPIYSLETNRAEGFEALARWHHQTLGEISPDKFIPLAEELSLIDALGERILRKACRQFKALTADLTNQESLFLSINISCKQFAQPNMVQKIKRILDETNFSPTNLKVEITESVFFEHKEKAVAMLYQLRELGIDINIDDFGTGYSNLSYLVQMPISTLKIDRSFISPMDKSGANMEIVKTVMMMARNFNLRVIAEGVETETQMQQLKSLNCESAQGFFFSKPLDCEGVQTFLRENFYPEMQNQPFTEVAVCSVVQ